MNIFEEGKKKEEKKKKKKKKKTLPTSSFLPVTRSRLSRADPSPHLFIACYCLINKKYLLYVHVLHVFFPFEKTTDDTYLTRPI